MLSTIILVVALVLFVLDGIGFKIARISNLQSIALAVFMLSLLAGRWFVL